MKSNGLILDLGCACQNSRRIREGTRTARPHPLLAVKPARSPGWGRPHRWPQWRGSGQEQSFSLGAPPGRSSMETQRRTGQKVGHGLHCWRASHWVDEAGLASTFWEEPASGNISPNRSGKHLGPPVLLSLGARGLKRTGHRGGGGQAGRRVLGSSSGSDPSPADLSVASISLLACLSPAVWGALELCVKCSHVHWKQ